MKACKRVVNFLMITSALTALVVAMKANGGSMTFDSAGRMIAASAFVFLVSFWINIEIADLDNANTDTDDDIQKEKPQDGNPKGQ